MLSYPTLIKADNIANMVPPNIKISWPKNFSLEKDMGDTHLLHTGTKALPLKLVAQANQFPPLLALKWITLWKVEVIQSQWKS